MKIWFRTGCERGGAERGEGQGSEQSRPTGSLGPSVFSAASLCVQPAAGRIPLVLRHESAPRQFALKPRCLGPRRFRGMGNFPTALPGSGQKVEVTENTRLNPVYPVLDLHIATRELHSQTHFLIENSDYYNHR